MLDLKLLDMPRDDPDHLAAGSQRRIGGNTHQADPSAAIDQLQSALADLATDSARRILVVLVHTAGRAAINANCPHIGHWISWWI